MKVKYVGFGGIGIEEPVYEDENGKLYFDQGNCHGTLSLYTGAYRDKEFPNEILGEPNQRVTETIECDEPYTVHPRKFDYMMLSRYQMDCNYFLGNGNGYEGHLYFKTVEEHISEMKKLWESFSEEDKPEWLTMEQILDYEKKMLNVKYKKS